MKHPAVLPKEVGTAVARALAERFGGTRAQPTGDTLEGLLDLQM
jgi:hypothetical protein